MSSWATLLAATGFKPDVPNKALAITPTVPGDFRAPWVTASGFGTIIRSAKFLSIHCASGSLEFKSLQLKMSAHSARIGTRALAAAITTTDDGSIFEFSKPVSLTSGQIFTAA
jgi:hypothetical protein